MISKDIKYSYALFLDKGRVIFHIDDMDLQVVNDDIINIQAGKLNSFIEKYKTNKISRRFTKKLTTLLNTRSIICKV